MLNCSVGSESEGSPGIISLSCTSNIDITVLIGLIPVNIILTYLVVVIVK